MQEIERKFLVNSEAFKNKATKKTHFIQAYLNTHPERTIRIRVAGEEAFLTIKGKSSKNGLSRFEWEKNIPKSEALQLLELCEKGSIVKDRYLVPVGDHIFEVDEFFKENEGLVLAEIELNHEQETFNKPDWIGEEVTGKKEYYNSYLISKPYKSRNS